MVMDGVRFWNYCAFTLYIRRMGGWMKKLIMYIVRIFVYLKTKLLAFDFFQKTVIILLLANLLMANQLREMAIEATYESFGSYAGQASMNAEIAADACRDVLQRLR